MLEGWGPVDTDAVQVTPADAQRLRERYLLAIRRELPPGGLRITCVTADECESYTASSIEDAIDWLGHTICCGDGPKLETITGAKIDGDAQLVE